MRTDVLQVFAVCTHAAPFLAGITDCPSEMFGFHSTFRSVHALTFERAGALKEGVLAERVSPWTRRLKTENVELIRPLLSPTTLEMNVTAAGPDWGIVTDGDRGTELWKPIWKPRVLGRDDPSPFKVNYGGSRFNRWSIAGSLCVENATQQLLLEIEQAGLEATRRGFTNVALPINKTLEMHGQGRTELSAFADALVPTMSKQAKLLAATAVRISLVIGSNVWQSAFPKSDVIATEIADKVWKSAMVGLETAAMAPYCG